MQFRILGPLEIVDGDRSLRLAAPMQRAVLGQLLLAAGRAVAVDELVEYLWDGAQPTKPRNAVQLLVLRLRRSMAEFGCAAQIESVPDAYRVELGDDGLDAAQFEDLLAGAADARERGDADAEQQLLETALGLWRGPVLGRPLAEWGEPVRAGQLTEAHVTAAEQLAAVELTRGHPDRALAVVLRFLAEHPGRERLRLLQILALYRGGRRAEALAAYDSAYRHAVDELGLEPGAELRQLQQDILAGAEPADHRPRRAAAAVVREQPRPAALPMRLTGFVGRAALVELLGARLVGGAVCGISGMAGVGKSALALHVAHSIRDEFPDGQLFADLGAGGGTATASDVLLRFLRLLGQGDGAIPDSTQARAELFRARTGGRRLLVLLDNAASAAQVRDLLPGGGGSAVLITSRTALTGVDGVEWHMLDVFDHEESIAVLSSLVGERRVHDALESSMRVVRYCGQLPLALRVVGARLAARPSWSMTRLAGHLADEQQLLDRLAADDVAVRSSIAVSYQLCTAEQRRALRLISLLDTPWFSSWAVAAMLDTDLDTATEIVEQLVDAQLVQPLNADDATGIVHYRLHDLVQLFAREESHRGDPDPVRHTAITRFVTAARALTERAAGAFLVRRSWFVDLPLPLPPAVGASTPAEALAAPGVAIGSSALAGALAAPGVARAWLDAEGPVLVAAALQAAGAGLAVESTGLVAALGDHLELSMRRSDQVQLHLAALRACEANGMVPDLLAGHHVVLADLGRDGGDPGPTRHLARARTLFAAPSPDRSREHARGLARCELTAAHVAFAASRPVEAADGYREAARSLAAAGDTVGLAEAWLSLGETTTWLAARAGDDDTRRALLGESLRCGVHALDAARQAGDRYGEARVHGLLLATAYRESGDLANAAASARMAADLADRLASPYLSLVASLLRVEIAIARSDLDAAATTLDRATQQAATLGVADTTLRCIDLSGQLQQAVGDLDAAVDSFAHMLATAQDAGAWPARAVAAARLAAIYDRTNRPTEAARMRRLTTT